MNVEKTDPKSTLPLGATERDQPNEAVTDPWAKYVVITDPVPNERDSPNAVITDPIGIIHCGQIIVIAMDDIKTILAIFMTTAYAFQPKIYNGNETELRS